MVWVFVWAVCMWSRYRLSFWRKLPESRTTCIIALWIFLSHHLTSHLTFNGMTHYLTDVLAQRFCLALVVTNLFQIL